MNFDAYFARVIGFWIWVVAILMILICLLSFFGGVQYAQGAEPDLRTCKDECLLAIAGNAMGEFCEHWDLSDVEMSASSQMNLYRTVARKVLLGEVYNIREYGGRTILIKNTYTEVEACFKEYCKTRKYKEIPELYTRLWYISSSNGYCEFRWDTSHSEQGLVRYFVTHLKDVRPGRPDRR